MKHSCQYNFTHRSMIIGEDSEFAERMKNKQMKTGMGKKRHLKLAGFMMALSWALLFGFVVHWLIGRYGYEKEVLTRELERQFTETEVQAMDSVLMINVVNPLMKNRKGFASVTTRVDTNVLYINRTGSVRGTMDKNQHQQIVYKIDVSDSLSMKTPTPHADLMREDTGNLVLRSIRLIVGQAVDTLHGRMTLKELLPREPDTAMIRRIFAGKLEQRGFDFRVAMITSKSMHPTVSRRSMIIPSEKSFPGSVRAAVSHFYWYLVRQILPQVLFALVLLVLTAGSFLFAFRTLRKQEQLNELRNSFISNITHELKTPVATVRVALESLGSFGMKSDPEVTAEYLRMASLEMERLDGLIARVLNLSVLEENRRVINVCEADLKRLAEKVIRSMKPRLEQEGAEVVIDAPGERYDCMIDELFVEGVLINLVDNSLKYAEGKPLIAVSLSGDDHSVRISVSDNGPGIPEEYIHRVFDRFFRVPTGDRHNVKGHGLGLSYAAQVMQQHHGSITVKNNETSGCTFTLEFKKPT